MLRTQWFLDSQLVCRYWQFQYRCWAADAGASKPGKSSSDGGGSTIDVWSSGGRMQIPPLQILNDH